MAEQEPLDKKAILVVAAPLLVTVLIVVALFLFVFNDKDNSNNSTETPKVSSNIKASAEDKVEVESLSEQFLQQVGTFGVETNKITDKNIDDMTTLLETDPDNTNYYFTNRQKAYNSSVDMVMKNAPIYYSPEETSKWSNDFETLSSVSFSMGKINAEAENTMRYMSVDGARYQSLSVRVKFDSTERMYIEQGSEIGAIRSYDVMEHKFNSNVADITFVKDSENNWKVYNINSLKNKFLLATWDDPNVDAFANTQFGFAKVDTLTPPDQKDTTTPDGQPKKKSDKKDSDKGSVSSDSGE